MMDFGLGRRRGQGQGKHARSVFVLAVLNLTKKLILSFFGAGRGEAWSGATEARDGLDFGLGRSRG